MKSYACAALFLGLIGEVYALQRVTLEGTNARPILVSLRDYNRLSFKGSKIRSLFGMVGDLSYKVDKTTGTLYFRVLRNHPISLTVVNIKGDHKDLLLLSKDIPSQTIEIQPKPLKGVKKVAKKLSLKKDFEEVRPLLSSFIKGILGGKSLKASPVQKEGYAYKPLEKITFAKVPFYKIHIALEEEKTFDDVEAALLSETFGLKGLVFKKFKKLSEREGVMFVGVQS